MRKELISNTTGLHRLHRALNNGLKDIRNIRSSYKEPEAHLTYYLLYNGVIVPFRKWYQMDRPDFRITGSLKGCIEHQKSQHEKFPNVYPMPTVA